MSQQWEYKTVRIGRNWGDETQYENSVNAELARSAAQGWELVNGSFGALGETVRGESMWLFWRRAK